MASGRRLSSLSWRALLLTATTNNAYYLRVDAINIFFSLHSCMFSEETAFVVAPSEKKVTATDARACDIRPKSWIRRGIVSGLTVAPNVLRFSRCEPFQFSSLQSPASRVHPRSVFCFCLGGSSFGS
ncbi:hypothetical protein L596_005849 [Steinernema carpocapsae]|uniref:Uncharacterized protein n=1 Tax=Steinernema carpocapsae TaxID=34508 RepID=A0A4U8V0F2_STECR|nr:hypothetical protein L596_005849 [Steinernema carpocapsae]